MNKLITIALLAFTSALFGQDLMPIYGDSINTGHEINISSFNYYSTNSFNNDLTNKFIYGGNIDSTIKNFNQGKLGRINSMGGEFEQKLEYINFNISPIKSLPNLGLVIGVEDINYVSSNMASDLYNITFFGNQNYLGDTMDFSFSHLQYLHYQKLSIGLISKTSRSSLKVSFVSGNKSIEYRLGNTWMYSSELSDSIKFNLNAEGFRTDSTSSYFSSKGQGFAFDLNHNFIYSNRKGKKQVLNFKLGNLGVIFWNNNTTYNYVDSANTYSGFNVFDLIDGSTSKLSSDTLGIYSKQRSKAELLPFELSIQKLANRNSDQKFQLIFGFKSIISSDYKPYLYVGGYYAPTENFSLSSSVAYGGFGGFKMRLNANYFLNNTLQISLGSYDLIGFISQKYGFGKSFHFSIRIKF